MYNFFIGSEGSLCFVSEVVLHCVDDYDNKSSGLLFYENLTVASMAITKLANLNKGIIAAAEIMDYACLLASQKIPEVSDILSDITEHTTCILLQTQHTDFDRMCKNLQSIQEAIQDVPTIRESLFSFPNRTEDSSLPHIRLQDSSRTSLRIPLPSPLRLSATSAHRNRQGL